MDFLSLAANIITFAQTLSHLPQVQKLRIKSDRKKFEAAYHQAFTKFFDSYGPASDDLVIHYDFSVINNLMKRI